MKLIVGLAASVVTLAALGGAAFAADLIVDEAPVASPAMSSGIKGVIDLGVLATFASQTDDPFDGWAGGGYVGANLWGLSDSFYWGLDGYLEANSFESTDEEAPNFVGTFGGHVGFGTESVRLGGFGSVGFTPNSANEAKAGYTVGVEGLAMFDGFGILGQLGYADVRTDDLDSGFTGAFARVGALFALSDDFAVLADASYGKTGDFEDEGDEGTFWSAGIKGAFRLPTDFDAFLTAGYEYQHYQANTEDDGFSHTIKLGLSIPFGDSTAVDALNPLGTSSMPYRAASWAETLD